MAFTPDQEMQIIKSLAKIEERCEVLPSIKDKVDKNTRHRNRINGALILLTFLIPVYLKYYHKQNPVKLTKPPVAILKDNP
jgi:hypothetical protein